MQKGKLKNPLPKEIELTLAFDVSTSKTGYAVLMNGKPFQMLNGQFSVGQIDMIIKEPSKTNPNKLTKKEKNFDNYGDKMLHGSRRTIDTLGALVYFCLSPINEIIGNELKAKKPRTKIKSFNVVYEVSEIPNFGRFKNGGQTISTVRKIALFVGAVQEKINSVLYNACFHFVDKATQKFIKPTEWQERLWRKQGNRKDTKEMSVKFANLQLKKWGLPEIDKTQDDMADAINIASVASAVRDNLAVRTINNNKKKNVNQMKKELADAITMINKITIAAQDKKIRHIERIRNSKNSKYNVADETKKPLTKFMSAKELESYNKNNNKRIQLEEKLRDIRDAKVYS